MPAAIMADEPGPLATISDGEVAHVGGYAIWFRRGCQNSPVERC